MARRSIAAVAARLLAEEGIEDYGLAKRKAARQLGLTIREGLLPGNAEIEEALRAHQALYQEEELPQRLAMLRRAAVSLMQLLESFRPYLVGSVLDGTAGRFARIELEAFPDNSKDVEIFLLERRIPFQLAASPGQGAGRPETVLSLDWQDNPVLLSLYQPGAERQPRRRGGRGGERARWPAVQALLAESST